MISTIPEDEFMKECGMDALCYVRILRMGYKICLVGILNSIWLFPTYATAPEDTSENAVPITDRVVETTIAHVPPGSPRLIATSIAAWIIFGYTMYLILQELEWFTDKRHKFLSMVQPRNYTIYVSDIPPELQFGPELCQFFRECFSYESVLNAHIRLHTSNVGSMVTQREAVITKLEHAVAVEDVTGKTPTHSPSLTTRGDKVDSITTYAEELKELNNEISQRITEIEASQRSKDIKDVEESLSLSMNKANTESMSLADNVGMQVETESHADDLSTLASKPYPDNTQHSGKSDSTASKLVGASTNLFKKSLKSAAAVGDGALDLLKGSEDGEPFSGGFVTFTNLRTTSAALQLLHHNKPHVMKVQEAPDPSDIFWFNVGRKNRELQVGRLLSLAATSALCLLWTIPVTFVASLSSVEALREEFDFIDDLLNNAPFLVGVFEIGAPLLLVIFNALLPIILEIFSMLEGPVSGAVVEASLFTKLAYFMIIQTFFVSALSGSIMEVSIIIGCATFFWHTLAHILLQELADLVENPQFEKIINLLATSLPAQSTFFIQLIVVQTVISAAMETLRVIPLVKALLRKYIGPKLTKKERQKAFMGLQPLADPLPFEHADFTSNLVLYFIVVFVYSVMSPLTNYFVAFCFAYLGWLFRHQFIYIYPAENDSGGRLWISFIRIMITCMFIGEFTSKSKARFYLLFDTRLTWDFAVIGLLALKQSAMAIPFMLPLIIVTVLFSAYINQEHFRVAETRKYLVATGVAFLLILLL